jgi:hypothetical protein
MATNDKYLRMVFEQAQQVMAAVSPMSNNVGALQARAS